MIWNLLHPSVHMIPVAQKGIKFRCRLFHKRMIRHISMDCMILVLPNSSQSTLGSKNSRKHQEKSKASYKILLLSRLSKLFIQTHTSLHRSRVSASKLDYRWTMHMVIHLQSLQNPRYKTQIKWWEIKQQVSRTMILAIALGFHLNTRFLSQITSYKLSRFKMKR